MEAVLKLFDLTATDAQMIPVAAIFFFVLWHATARFLFRPYLNLLDVREARTTGASETAHQKLAKTKELLLQVEDGLSKARVEVTKEKLATLSKHRAEAQQILEKAEQRAQERIATARESREKQLATVAGQLDSESAALSGMIAQKIKNGGVQLQ